MALTINTLAQSVNLSKSDVKNSLTDSQPFLPNSFLGAICTGIGGRKFDSDNLLIYLSEQMFPQTAEDLFLEYLGDVVNIYRNAASQSSGQIVFTGTSGKIIPTGTILQSSTSNSYTTSAAVTIGSNEVSITQLLYSGGRAFAQTSVDHNMATGQDVDVSGADQSGYNGTQTIVVTGLNTFEYNVSDTPASPATGTIIVTNISAIASVESDGYGDDQNVSSGGEITLTTGISGVDSTVIAAYDGISGGSDIETDDDFRARIVYAWQNPVANFNIAAIEQKALEVSGTTRVWVEPVTPLAGQVTIYFVRDNDTNIIPTETNVQLVKNSILEILPANTEEEDVIVSAPTEVTVDFEFTSITPDTTGIRSAINNSLVVLFDDSTTVGTDLSDKAYISTIYNAIDTDTGDRVTDFTLTSPSGSVTIASGELAVLGEVTFT